MTVPLSENPAQPAVAGTGDEFRAMTALVPRVVAGTILVLLVGTYATNNDVTGNFNKPMYLIIVALAAIITVAFLRDHRSTTLDIALALLATGGVVVGIAAIERPQLLTYWGGFGNRVAVGTVVLLVALLASFSVRLHLERFSNGVVIALGVVVCICCLCDVLGIVRTVDYFPAVGNNLNQVNDMLAPVSGKIPESTFVPEYTALYGWLLVPFKHLLSPFGLVNAVAILLTTFSIAALLLAVWIVRRLFAAWGWLIALVLVVPITLVISRLAGDISSIASSSQELPIRMFSGFVIAAIGLPDLVLLYRGTARSRRLVIVGLVCGVISWNSQDFGLAATGVYGLMIVVGATSSTRWRALGPWLMGVLIGVLAYPLFLLAIGSPLNLGYVGAFVRSAGSLGPAAIQVPGPVMVIVPIIICSAATGWALMRVRRREGRRHDPLLDQATITLTFVGTWAAICLIYYVNRAYAAGQLQTMLLPCGVCIAALVAVVMRTDEFTALWRQKEDMTMPAWGTRLKFVPLGVFACLCCASVVLTTNPVQAVHDLVNPATSDGYTKYDLPQVIAAVDAAQRLTAAHGATLTYLGESSSYVSLVTHVASSALLYGFPFSRINSAAQTQVAQFECRYLKSHESQWLVLSANGVTGFGDSACGLYHSVNLPGYARGQLQELGST